MKLKEFCKKYKYTFTTLILICISIVFAIFIFSGAYKDLIESIKLAFNYLIGIFQEKTETTIPPPIPIIPSSPDSGVIILPENPAIIIARLRIWGQMYLTSDTYSFFFSELIYYAMLLMVWSPAIILTFILIKKLIVAIFLHENTKHGQVTLPLKGYLWVSKVSITPSVNYSRNWWQHIKESKLRFVLLIIWALNLNIFSILIPILPYYFYCCFNLSFTNFYDFIKFELSKTKYIFMLGLIIIIPAILIVIDKFRIAYALHKLRSFEEYNRKVLEGRELVTYKDGVMGSGKTRLMTQEVLQESVIFTNKAFELKNVCKKMFPFFPWLLYELDIEKNIKEKKIYSWASAIDYVANLEKEFNEGTHSLFNYNYKKYRNTYYNGLVNNNLFDVLKDYAKLHFLYIFVGSYIVSNYPIRESKEMMTVGNSVRWDCDFFNFDKDFEESSYYSKILDFDYIRMLTKFDESPIKDSFEFGIISITEADKEQANAVQTLNDSSESPYPNPKNDGISLFEKFIRHHATIMGYCFAVIFKDGQRAMSLNADTREISTLEHLQKPSKEKNALPFFFIEKTAGHISNFIDRKFLDDKEYYRGDNTLFYYTLTYISAVLYNFYYRRKNRYGYAIASKILEAGVMDGKETTVKTYLLFAIVYADAYKTDTHSANFEEKSRKSGTGILNYESYQKTKMSDAELDKQNSYSGKNLHDPDWKKPYIEKANAEKEEKKALDKAKAKKKAKEIEE